MLSRDHFAYSVAVHIESTLLASVLLAGLASAQVPQTGERSKESPILHTSICEALAKPERFGWKLVEIQATYGGTFEGAWISDSECKNLVGQVVPPFQRGMDKSYDDVVQRVSKEYGLTDVIRDKGWEEFNNASRQLYTGLDYRLADGTWVQGKYDSVTAKFTGILVVKKDFRVKRGFGNGWGHLGMSRFLLVLRSVSNVKPHPCACPPTEETAPFGRP